MGQLPPEQLAILAKEDQGPLTKSIVIAFTIFAFLCVSLRLFTRVRYKVVGWEDYTIVLSMLLSIGTAVFQILQANAGSGKHAIFIPFPEGVERILKNLFWSIIFYNASLMCTKISILLQYGRLFTVTPMRIPLHVVMGICVAWGITTLFTSIFTCVPVHAYWKILEQADAKCLNNKTLWYVNASFNMMTDLLVATLPIRVIWGLQIPKRQKIAILCVLTIGWFVCVVSILRLHALIQLATHPEDTTWYSSAAAYWSAIEMDLAIVCASLPALKPLLVKIIPGFSSHHGSRTHGSTSLTGRIKGHVLGSKGTRHMAIGDVKLADQSLSSKAYPSTCEGSVYGQNIFVSHSFEQHVEEQGQMSDGESQKDLVTTPRTVHANY